MLAVLVGALAAGCTFDRSGLALAPRLDTSHDRADAARLDGASTRPESSRDGPIDGQVDRPGADRSSLEAALPDQRREKLPLDQPIPDQPPPKPDSGGCLTESFATGLGQVLPKTGQWALSGGALRQSVAGGGNYAVIDGVTASNYVVSARVTVHSLFPKPGWTRGAALGVRLQAGTLTPRQYLCGVYPGTQALVIVHCSGGDPNNTCQVVKQAGPAVAIGATVLVRATDDRALAALPRRGDPGDARRRRSQGDRGRARAARLEP
jgi:hypothetical protein